jgi:hypothetical protein
VNDTAVTVMLRLRSESGKTGVQRYEGLSFPCGVGRLDRRSQWPTVGSPPETRRSARTAKAAADAWAHYEHLALSDGTMTDAVKQWDAGCVTHSNKEVSCR